MDENKKGIEIVPRHEYRIYSSVYDDIIIGKKTVEFRLLNDKSSSIKIGDDILFKVIDNEEKNILVEVTNIYLYNDLNELWNSKECLNNNLNYTKEEFVEVFNNIFGIDKVNNSKIVGIEFKLK